MDVSEPESENTIGMIVTDLSLIFSDVDPTEITAVAREEFDRVTAQSRVPTFVGILSERRARDRLQAQTYRRSA